MRRTAEALFGAVCLCCSAALLLLSLLGAIRLTRLNDEAVALEREIRQLREDNTYTRALYESSLDLEALERRAVSELGLQHLRGEQLETVPLPEAEDAAEQD